MGDLRDRKTELYIYITRPCISTVYDLNFEKLFKLFNTSSEQTEDCNVTPGKKWPKIARIS